MATSRKFQGNWSHHLASCTVVPVAGTANSDPWPARVGDQPGLCARAPAAEQLLVRFSGLELPLDLNELESWALRPKVNAELGPWLNLLDPATRQDLQRILRQPLNLESSTIALLLDSWAGRQLVLQLGSLLRSADGDGGPLLLDLLQRRGRSTVVSLLKEAPTSHLELDLDALSALGFRLRGQLEQQKNLLKQLNDLRLMPLSVFRSTRGPVRHQQRSLAVEHREAPWHLICGGPLVGLQPNDGCCSAMVWGARRPRWNGWPVS